MKCLGILHIDVKYWDT